MEVSYRGRRIRYGTLAALFDELPRKLRGPAVEQAAAYYVAEIRKYPPYKMVARARAYPDAKAGPGWFSDKQRRFVMASLRAGRNLKTGAPMEPGYPHRTGNTQRAWQVTGKGVSARITNAAPAAVHLFDDKRQARQPGLVGWQKLAALIADAADDVTDKMLDWAIEKLYKDIDAGLR